MKSLIRVRKNLVFVIFSLAIASSFMLAGCARKSGGGSDAESGNGGSGAPSVAKKGGKVVVGFSQMENDGPWRIAETTSIKNEGAKRKEQFELRVTDARGSTSQQVNDVEDLISQGVGAIFLAPREKEGLASALQSARDAKIPVILVDREAAGTPGVDFVTVLKSNFIEEGKRAADWLVKQTNGKANIVELAGTSGASVSIDRAQGFRDGLGGHPDMKIIATQIGDFNRAKAQNVMQNIIQSMGKQITAVYTHNDEMALGAIQALKDAGMKPGVDVLVVSVDGEKAALEAIMRGDMNATVECNPRFGPLAFDTLQKYLNGEKIPPQIINEDRFFDKTNAAQFINEAY